MRNIIKFAVISSFINLLISPLVGWGMAQTGLPTVVAVYAMILILGWPIGVIGWSALYRE